MSPPVEAASFRMGAAVCIEACRSGLTRLLDAAPGAEREDCCAYISLSFRELAQQYSENLLDHESGQGDSDILPAAPGRNADERQGLQAWDPPSAHRPDSYADTSVETERRAMRRMSTMQVLEVLDLGIPFGMEVELTPHHVARTFDVQRDLASVVCGRSAAALAIRLRWLGVSIWVLGACSPILVMFAMHWATGGLGEFALAYTWPPWLEVWTCVGWWLFVGMLLLWFASMQREIAWMALKRFSTVWIIIMTGLFVAAHVSVHDFGVSHAPWFVLPLHIGVALFVPLVAMADALPPKLRLPILRYCAPFMIGCAGTIAVVLRLPTAKDTPGILVWAVMGIDTVTNLQALAYSTTVITLLLAEGILNAWVFPNELAFIQTSLCIAELAGGAPALGGQQSANAVSSVAPNRVGENAGALEADETPLDHVAIGWFSHTEMAET